MHGLRFQDNKTVQYLFIESSNEVLNLKISKHYLMSLLKIVVSEKTLIRAKF